MVQTAGYALSIKQPWATLLVHGHKTIEIRRWPTARRGPILIHAGLLADERPEAWKHVTEELKESASLRGGIIGVAELNGCISYPSLDDFVKDQASHLNEPEWYESPVLYGFSFTAAQVLPFRKYPGWMRFFPVTEGPFQRKK